MEILDNSFPQQICDHTLVTVDAQALFDNRLNTEEEKRAHRRGRPSSPIAIRHLCLFIKIIIIIIISWILDADSLPWFQRP